MKAQQIKTRLFLMVAMAIMSLVAVPSAWAETQNITGEWKFHIIPSIDIDDPLSESSVWVADLYDVNGGIVGFSGVFQFQGSRSGDKVTLNVLSTDGHKKVRHRGTLNLKLLVEPKKPLRMVGTQVINDTHVGYKGLNVSKVSATRVGAPPSLQALTAARDDTWPLEPGETALENSASDWITKIITYFENKVVINELIWNSCHQTYDWMKAWDVIENGRGYYMCGDHAPGSLSYATWTFYYPLDWGYGGSTTYSFYYRSGPAYQTIDQLRFTLQGIGDTFPKCLGFSDNSDLVSTVTDFYNNYGDFTISTAYEENTAQAHLYVNLANSANCDAAKNHPLVQKIWGQLSHHDKLLCGHDIYDTWYLKRPFVLLDGTPLYITNVLGTISVWYD